MLFLDSKNQASIYWYFIGWHKTYAILSFAKAAILGQGDTRMTNVCHIGLPHYTVLSLATKIWTKKIKDGGRRHLEFHKTGILGNHNLCMTTTCLCIKFDANIFIGDGDMAKIQIQDDPSRYLKFCKKLGFRATIIRIWPISICHYVPNFTQISSLAAEIWHTNRNSRWQPPASRILTKV